MATGIGLDTVPGPVYREDTDTQFGLSFASIVIPIRNPWFDHRLSTRGGEHRK